MKRDELNDLAAFIIVAEEKSFTRAAAKLGISISGLSRSMRSLEEKLQIRLLSRTTRSVSPTEAGENLLRSLRPAFHEIERGLLNIKTSSGRLSGTIRITTNKHAAAAILWPVIPRFLSSHSEVKIEIAVADELVDIVSSKFDAGIRLGEKIDKDMIAVRISPDVRPAIVATPNYFRSHSRPKNPTELSGHNCINYRMASSGGLYAWELKKNGQAHRVRVEGTLIVNDIDLLLHATLTDHGIAWCPEDVVIPYIKTGELIRVLEDWSEPFTGYYLYYPNRRHLAPALAAFIEAIRYHP
ncbi:LysR family transcriptional regulator [Pseudomonas mandelii]|uniref:LysR family transcriptional regulator n=1 Tax=Pseudomonas mandelii TaxID=75612 RepID=UPI00209F19BA|nr:LysR family transcriptional regulator [Pseudomonas mandelii]MCO8310960.1 LysR family transcriptional regulator [Pseudomonas mandelii]